MKFKDFFYGLYESNLNYNRMNRPDTASRAQRKDH